MNLCAYQRPLQLLTLITCLVATMPSHAGDTRATATGAKNGNPSACPVSGVSSEGPECGKADEGVADPLHVLTGNSYQAVSVYSGGGEFPLRFKLHYNSRWRPDSSNSSFRGQWTYSYGDRLIINSTNVTLEQSDGRLVAFDVNGNNLDLSLRNSATAIYGTLTKSGTDYFYQPNAYKTYRFNSVGQLTEVTNRNGLSHSLARTTEGSGTKITVTHSSGQTIQLLFPNINQQLPTSLSDPFNNTYGIGVNSVDSIELVNSVSYPDYQSSGDSTVSFQYLSSHPNPSPNWLYRTALKAVVDEEGWQKSFWSYSDEGYAIHNYLGTANDATDVFDLSPVEAELGASQHNAIVTTPYGCKIKYTYHSFRKGQAYKVLPWLNTVMGDDNRNGCAMTGTLKHYSKMLNAEDWLEGGLLDSGYPNMFENNVFTKYKGWDGSIGKNTERIVSFLNEGGEDDTVVGREVYTYHPQIKRATLIKRYQDESESSLWQEIHYTYYDGVTDPINNGRIKTKKVIDKKGVTNGSPTQVWEREWQYQYLYHDNAHKRVSQRTVIDPRGYSTVTTYNADGYVSSTSRPIDLSGPTTQHNHLTTYDNFTALGQAQTITDSNSLITQKGFNARGWLRSVTRGSKTTNYDYYLNGLLKRVTQPGGDWVEYEYTTARTLKKTLYSNGDSQTRTEHVDRNGTHQKTVTTNWFASGSPTPTQTHTSTYDALERLISQTQANGVETLYFYEDPRFNDKVTKIIEKGDSNYPDRITKYTYTPLGELKTSATGENPSTPDITYDYDNIGNLTDVTDGNGHKTHYEFDGFQQVLSLSSPDTENTFYEYDASGNLVSKFDSDLRIVEYEYDRLNRVWTITYPHNLSENTVYQYDATEAGNFGVGRRTGIWDQSGNTHLSYDQQGRITNKSVLLENTQYDWGYNYNDNDSLVQLTYPSGRIVDYVRDPQSQRVTSVTSKDWAGAPTRTIAENVQYLPSGLDTLSFGNQLSLDIDYDQNGRYSAIKTLGQNAILDRGYDYNSLNSITDIVDATQPSHSQTFTYDEHDRLYQANGGYGSKEFQYDAVGNRTSASVLSTPNSNEVYSYIDPVSGQSTSNRLWSVNTDGQTRSFDYDAAGNIIQDTRLNSSFDYSMSNRLIQVQNDHGQFNYTHNHLGQRVIKLSSTLASGGQHFHYGESANLMGEYDRDGKVIKEYVYTNGRLLAFFEPNLGSDTDGDGMDDDWEQLHFGNLSHSGTSDDDLDGVTALQEFISGRNPLATETTPGETFVDTDNDGLADDWEQLYFGNLAQSATDDSDGDGIDHLQEQQDNTDPTDNYSGGGLNVDSDQDDMLDRWEVSYFGTITKTGLEDIDGDGLSNKQEYQHDSDPTDQRSGGRVNTDADADGMMDRWEFYYFGTFDRDGLGDFDEDSVSDAKEFMYQFDPTNPADGHAWQRIQLIKTMMLLEP